MEDIDNERGYKRARVLNGYSPHKMLNKVIKEKIVEDEDEKKGIFSIDYFEWRGIHDVFNTE